MILSLLTIIVDLLVPTHFFPPRKSGFENVSVELKKESREFIKDWLPGSGAEDYIVSASVVAYKPMLKRVSADEACGTDC